MKKITDIVKDSGCTGEPFRAPCPLDMGRKQKVSVVALGDVGTTMVIGLRLLGEPVIEEIGIFDISRANMDRLEMEINQIGWPDREQRPMPPVKTIDEDEIFSSDLVIFCASRGVPPVEPGTPVTDVRMVQLEANRKIISYYGELARVQEFKGLFCVVSDPVDPLCGAFLDASGLEPYQIRGFGLGVMNMRAAYLAEREERFSPYLKDGRVFGPHGSGLVAANSISDYDDQISRELTELTTAANLKVRDLGFKPFIAPALSSAALSVISLLQGRWHYSSVFMGKAYLGMRNRLTQDGTELEDLDLDPRLYSRILESYMDLAALRD